MAVREHEELEEEEEAWWWKKRLLKRDIDVGSCKSSCKYCWIGDSKSKGGGWLWDCWVFIIILDMPNWFSNKRGIEEYCDEWRSGND